MTRIARVGGGFRGLPIAALFETDALLQSAPTGDSDDSWRKYAYK